MEKLSVKDLRILKREFLSKWAKYAIKQSEQTGGEVHFKVDGETYTLKYGPTAAYTNFKLDQMRHRCGVMNRGAGPLLQDKYGKINHKENNVINQLDRKLKKENK